MDNIELTNMEARVIRRQPSASITRKIIKAVTLIVMILIVIGTVVSFLYNMIKNNGETGKSVEQLMNVLNTLNKLNSPNIGFIQVAGWNSTRN